MSEEKEAGPVALSAAFYDDVHGTAKSLHSLKQHSDFSKWLKASSFTPSLLKQLEKKLQVYQVTLPPETKECSKMRYTAVSFSSQ